MEHVIKQLKNGAKHTRLSILEKAEIKSALLSYTKANPARVSHSVPSFFNMSDLRNKKGISILVLGGLLMGGTVSFAAESTLPGDTLYPVKLHVNEKVRSVVAVTPKAKAEWEVHLVERRLEEMEKLATAGDVSPAVQELAHENLATYTKHAEARIKEFEDTDDDEDAMQMATSLSRVLNDHEHILVVMDTDLTTTAESLATSTTDSVATTSPRVKEVLNQVRDVRGSVEKKNKELEVRYRKEESVKKNEEKKLEPEEQANVVATSSISFSVNAVQTITDSLKNITQTQEKTKDAEKDGQRDALVSKEKKDRESRREELRAATNIPSQELHNDAKEAPKDSESSR